MPLHLDVSGWYPRSRDFLMETSYKYSNLHFMDAFKVQLVIAPRLFWGYIVNPLTLNILRSARARHHGWVRREGGEQAWMAKFKARKAAIFSAFPAQLEARRAVEIFQTGIHYVISVLSKIFRPRVLQLRKQNIFNSIRSRYTMSVDS